MSITIIRARLRGPSTLVQPVEADLPLQWLPNYGEFVGPLDSVEGQAVLAAHITGQPLYQDNRDWYVTELNVAVEPL